MALTSSSNPKVLSKCSILMLVIGCAMTVLGIISAVLRFPQNLMDEQFRAHLTLGLDSPVFETWMNPPTAVYMEYYMFNVTNIPDILNGGKPNVVERGPYTYAMTLKRFDVRFYTNDSVAFRFNRTLTFIPELSSGKEDDVIYHLNMPLATIAGMMEKMPSSGLEPAIFEEILSLIGEKDLFVPHNVTEILFGYVDPFFKFLSEFLALVGISYDPMFGPFYKFNNSNDGVYLVNTGKSEYSKTNEIIKWNGIELLNYWTTTFANMINGTDGSFYQPYLKRDEKRYIFFSDMCRSLEMNYEADTNVKGVSTLRFHIASDIFANVSINPDNAAFCTPPGNCYDSGVLNVAQCRQQAPVLISLPHFYNAAQVYQDGVTGLHPSKEKHDFFSDVEPMTGIVFNGTRPMQVNMVIKSSNYVKQMKNISQVVFPVLWVGGASGLDDATQAELHSVLILNKFMKGVSYLTLGAGLITILGVAIHYLRKRHSKKYDLLANDTPNSL